MGHRQGGGAGLTRPATGATRGQAGQARRLPASRRRSTGLRIALHVWLLYNWSAGHLSEGRYRLGQVLARAGEPTVWRARGLLLAGFLAAVSSDRGTARVLLEQGISVAGQRNDPGHAGVHRLGCGHVCLFAGDLPQAIAHDEDGLAVLPAGTVHARQRALRLVCLSDAAGLTGDEERAVARVREVLALTEAGSEFICRWYSA